MIDEAQRHFPAKANTFEFDEEVSAIFPDMARRSIPNFLEAHEAHARMVAAMTANLSRVDVLDIGASRGHFLEALQRETYARNPCTFYSLTAAEKSPHMCRHLRNGFPSARVIDFDLETEEIKAQYDVIALHYVLQFLPPEAQHHALQKVLAALRPGGILVFGHKALSYGTLGDVAHDEYIDFRVRNGYTREEIAAKTKALAGSMHCANHESILSDIKASCSFVQETFRFMMFSTLIAVK